MLNQVSKLSSSILPRVSFTAGEARTFFTSNVNRGFFSIPSIAKPKYDHRAEKHFRAGETGHETVHHQQLNEHGRSPDDYANDHPHVPSTPTRHSADHSSPESIERLIDRLLPQQRDSLLSRLISKAPSKEWDIRVNEHNGQVHLDASLPGASKSDVKLTVSNGLLTVHAQQHSSGASANNKWESSAVLQKTYKLPDGVKQEDVKSEWRREGDTEIFHVSFPAEGRRH